ncbi:unnamed protein product [Adineta steineri]|uniref:Uncharacterized protein n=1 Tax=Adineta steineri TaxID=433720 RepID=A0A815QQX9_9BILA|nr:unnamed protein product [Adineta steineri]CAF1466894.1 unnamed protein product [Adineta steineri]
MHDFLTTKHFDLEHQEFDDPKTCEKLICNGRPCAKCHMCRDWHFTGDYDTWTRITNWENWTKDEWNRFRNDGIRNNFKERDGATFVEQTRKHLEEIVSTHMELILSNDWKGLLELTNANGKLCSHSYSVQAFRSFI